MGNRFLRRRRRTNGGDGTSATLATTSAAYQSARRCRFLRDEVTEQLAAGSKALTVLAKGWRKMLFPEATDAQFADGYAQAVTFGLLVARPRDIKLSDGMDRVAAELGGTNSLIGAALRIVTQEVEGEKTLKTSLDTLTRVLDVVNWQVISKDVPDAWRYFYEDFLEVYDNALRKRTGSYYTPPEVVGAMVRLVDEALRSSECFGLSRGLAANEVTVADSAVGTGTFMLGTHDDIASSRLPRTLVSFVFDCKGLNVAVERNYCRMRKVQRFGLGIR